MIVQLFLVRLKAGSSFYSGECDSRIQHILDQEQIWVLHRCGSERLREQESLASVSGCHLQETGMGLLPLGPVEPKEKCCE